MSAISQTVVSVFHYKFPWNKICEKYRILSSVPQQVIPTASALSLIHILLREAYLIPRKFHGKAGENPVLLTNVEGELLPEAGKMVSAHEYEKFKETFDRHECVPRSGLYLADGYDIVHSYTDGLEIKEEKEERQRGILILYALPDTCKLGLTEAQTYAVVWKTFQEIQQAAPHAVVFYGQETGIKKESRCV